jgi:hypothetical protein
MRFHVNLTSAADGATASASFTVAVLVLALLVLVVLALLVLVVLAPLVLVLVVLVLVVLALLVLVLAVDRVLNIIREILITPHVSLNTSLILCLYHFLKVLTILPNRIIY